MEIGLLTLGDNISSPVTGHKLSLLDKHKNILAIIDGAEAAGFGFINIGEHHFSDFVISSPQLFLAWCAARTKSIKLCSGISLAGIRNPILLAEDFSTLSYLSNGRAELWVGKGIDPKVNRIFGFDKDSLNSAYINNLSILKKYLSPDFTKSIEPSSIDNLPSEISPSPLGSVPISAACGSAEVAHICGQSGFDIVSTSVASTRKDLIDIGERFRNSNRDSVGQYTINCHMHVGETTAKARKHMSVHHPRFQKWVWSHINGKEVNDIQLPSRLTDYECADSSVIVGDHFEVIDRLQRLQEETGCTRIAIQTDHAGQDQETVRKSLRRFSEDVLPKLHQHSMQKVV